MKNTLVSRRRLAALAAQSVGLEMLESRRLMHGDFNVSFNFQPAGSAVPAGMIPDYGNTYADRGNGYAYGWNVDSRNAMRERNMLSDQRLDTHAQMQQDRNRTWELQIPNGQYEVTITSGDARYLDGHHHIAAEGTLVMYGQQTETKRFLNATKIITVTDGKLTLSPASTGVNSKINSLGIKSYHAPEPATKPTVSVVSSDGLATEDGDQGEYLLTRSNGNGALTVNWTWSSLATGSDYQIGRLTQATTFTARPNSITFENGVTEIRLRLRAVNDLAVEGNERATLNLSTSTAYNVSTTAFRAEILIRDNDGTTTPNPTITVSTTDGDATEGADTANIRFTRSGTDFSQQLIVPITWSGSAGSGDFSRPGSITFAAGASIADLTIAATDDTLDESDETATVTIASSTSYTTGSPAAASVLIRDNDEPTTNPSFSNINWSTTSSPANVFSETTSIVVNNKMYLFGGFNGVFQPQKHVYRFDGTTYTRLTDSPVAFTHVGAAEVDGKIWFVGGYLGKPTGGQIFGTTDVRIYDPSNDTWSTGPALPSARASGNLVKVGRKLYYFGGETLNRAGDSTTMWQLDLDNQAAGWTGRASMQLARNHASALEVNGKIYVLAGQTGYDNSTVAHDDIQIYHPATNSWTVASQKLPGNRSHTVSATQLHQGKIIIVAGQSAHNAPVNTVWSIDPSTLVTTALNTFPDARFSVATGILNGKLYAIGGYKGSIATQAYVGTFI